jgi:hypothetical protein
MTIAGERRVAGNPQMWSSANVAFQKEKGQQTADYQKGILDHETAAW